MHSRVSCVQRLCYLRLGCCAICKCSCVSVGSRAILCACVLRDLHALDHAAFITPNVPHKRKGPVLRA